MVRTLRLAVRHRTDQTAIVFIFVYFILLTKPTLETTIVDNNVTTNRLQDVLAALRDDDEEEELRGEQTDDNNNTTCSYRQQLFWFNNPALLFSLNITFLNCRFCCRYRLVSSSGTCCLWPCCAAWTATTNMVWYNQLYYLTLCYNSCNTLIMNIQ